MTQAIYALNLFDVANREEYLAYARRSVAEVTAHGGRVVALGKFREVVRGEVAPRSVMILVEWKSKAAFDAYRDDPALADLHPHRENSTANYVWHLFDRLEDLRPILKLVHEVPPKVTLRRTSFQLCSSWQNSCGWSTTAP